MKKRIATAVVAGVLMTAILAGCGKSADNAQANNSLFEQVSESGSEQSENAQSEAAPEVKEESQSDAQSQQAESESSLYDDFKAGNAKAKYTGAGDRTSYLETSLCLEKGKSYTMDEIVSALEGSTDYKKASDTTYTMIDCGSDGIPEMLTETFFDPEFTLYMIIKDIDGELVICFDQDAWSRSDLQVEADGKISSGGSGGAAIHIVDYAFVDAKGDYKFFYGCEETLTLYNDIYLYDKTDYQVLPVDGLDVDHIGIRDYYFEADYEQRTHYYEYFMINDNYEDVTTDADYEDSNPVKQKFNECGVKTYTHADIEALLNARAADIGYKR
ncbi:hypothetical protein [Butyrivibrio sp. FCS006]|uniref:hypothetical protein n=1 Tax=Butyrivibrio sp. FCS006 TaxID=1280684 RepID=UPI000404E621|nr:hypothetical protein [Butyrivibrio sp. FCS006]